ncbi:MAG TPA: BON domain-containing protein, partial [Pseudoalteromonas sp.]|nr:BON domain-containing protein [Pseudoalteromonas sp.]
NNIKVVTENAEVFLMGLVSESESNQAVNIARNVSGVERVIKVFEYL